MSDIEQNKQKVLTLEDFPHCRDERVRYRDTDRQGHVNNAVFSTFYECSRTEILYDPKRKLVSPEREFVIVTIQIDYMAELSWPGDVKIGTRVVRLGSSSVTCEQAISQNGVLASRAKSVMVMMDTATRKSTALPADAIASLSELISTAG